MNINFKRVVAAAVALSGYYRDHADPAWGGAHSISKCLAIREAGKALDRVAAELLGAAK